MIIGLVLLLAACCVAAVLLGVGAALLMSYPGGLPPPRPDQGYAPTGAPMAPGSQTPVVRANKVIIFGPSGQVVGLFVYPVGTTPGPGNPPVDSITRSNTDPFLNPVQPDFVAYGPGGAYAQLTDGQLLFVASSGQNQAAHVITENVAGFLDLFSGLASGGDTGSEFTLQSAQASGIPNGQTILNSGQFDVNAITTINDDLSVASANLNLGNGASANINLNPKMATPPNQANMSAGTATLAQVNAWGNGLYQSMKNRGLIN